MHTHGAPEHARVRALLRRTAAALSATALVTALAVALPVTGTPSGDGAAYAEDGPTAATEAEALRQAAGSGERVEVTDLRQERRTVYAQPDGSFTAVEHLNPVRVLSEGAWVDPDPTLVRHDDGTITPRASTVGLSISPGGEGPLATLTRAGKELSVDWPTALPEPELDGPRARYTSVLPDVDLVVRADVDGFSHVLVVHTPEAAASPELAELRLATEATGLEITVAERGLAAVDTGAGGNVFEAPEPLMWDSGDQGEAGQSSDGAAGPEGSQTEEGPTESSRIAPLAAEEPEGTAEPEGARPEDGPLESSRVATVSTDVEDGDIVLRPDQEMASAEDTAYPIYIDPVWKTSTLSAWAMVSSGYPGTSYWKFSGNDHEGVGRCPQLYGDPFHCNGTGVKRLFYRIPTGAYADKQILSAELAVTLRHTYNSTAYPVRAYRTGGFNSSTTWNNQPSWSKRQDTRSPSDPTASCTPTNQNVRFDVSEAVGRAADNGYSSTSFGLRAGDESTAVQWKRFCDNAQLEVRYNTVPDIPDQSWMGMSPGGACVYGTDRPYVDQPPRLTAYLSDGDEFSSSTEKLKAQFRVFWTDQNGEEQERTHTTSEKASGSFFHYQVPDDIPENTTVGWIVRASDGHAWGPWSWTGAQTRCEFVYDSTAPGEPEITSDDFPADDAWHDGVGVYGDFTFSSPSDDVVEYRYGVNEDPSAANTLPADADGTATLTWSPWHEGPHSLYVEAVDRAGKVSSRANHLFLVDGGRPAVGQWSMGDDAGSDGAADAAEGGRTAVAGAGVTFGEEGPGGDGSRAAALDGTEGAYLTPDARLVDTTGLFSVSAWVRLDDLSRDQVVVSQDGTGEPGFTLGYDASDQAWRVAFPDADMDALGGWGISAEATVTEGQWAHLAFAHDSHTDTVRFYVNGSPEGTVERETVWSAPGALQIGRSTTRSGYDRFLRGAVADVRVFDRIVSGYEFDRLRMLPVDRRSYWPFNAAVDGTSPEADGRDPMVLNGDAAIHESDPWGGDSALMGQGHLRLDGDGDSAGAFMDAPLAGSFTISARARLAAAAPEESMTVLSQTAYNTLIDLRYNAASGRWEAVLSDADTPEADPTVLEASDVAPSHENRGDHLLLVFDAFAQEVRFYVNGTHAVTRGFHPLWPTPQDLAEDPNAPWVLLNVGRAKADSYSWRQYFSGAVDDVRVYAGAADETLISALSRTTENPEL
ncbi:LamG-like jellyroll fold domain-containing protein [Nocardiopsis sp. FIRDI 009]|uniref:LamG-like jellyroll fold domain-containing protein n=1 Tax=Nocardiopsis sp. FIRDI 009 TaxID=714197 RepID=UPI000E261B9B|nr:LamG-like jellyroll fold domain-containing protein [Nocardiopsis sp. FIRDI 009]